MAKLDQIDEKLKHSEEDRNVIRKEMRNNKHEYLDNYFHLARATEEKLQQMSDKVETTDGERDKNIRKDMREMKQRYDAVNSQLGSLETRMDTMSREQAESSSAIQTKLDAILRNSTPQDRPAGERTQGNRVDFVEPQRNKRQSTPLPVPRDAASTTPGGGQGDYKKGNSEHNQWSRGLHYSQQHGTRCHDMGKHLGNDEQDARSLRHKEHRLE